MADLSCDAMADLFLCDGFSLKSCSKQSYVQGKYGWGGCSFYPEIIAKFLMQTSQNFYHTHAASLHAELRVN